MTTKQKKLQQIPLRPLNSATKENCLIPYSACFRKSGATRWTFFRSDQRLNALKVR